MWYWHFHHYHHQRWLRPWTCKTSALEYMWQGFMESSRWTITSLRLSLQPLRTLLGRVCYGGVRLWMGSLQTCKRYCTYVRRYSMIHFSSPSLSCMFHPLPHLSSPSLTTDLFTYFSCSKYAASVLCCRFKSCLMFGWNQRMASTS